MKGQRHMDTEAAGGRSRRLARRLWGTAIFTLTAALPVAARAEPPQGTTGAATTDTGPLRRALLMEHLKQPAETASVERYAPAIFGTISLATAVGVAVADFNEGTSRERWLTVGLFGGLGGPLLFVVLGPGSRV
jgi:hypothetical protein